MKIISVILCILMILCMSIPAFAEDVNPTLIEVSAKSAILMEMSSGKILYSKNADEKLSPASVTKIMTLLLAMEALEEKSIKLTDVVTASRNASEKGGSQIWLKEGEQMTVHELLKATAVASANDASTALGEFIAGDEQAFIAMMNKRAKELGMKNTSFENCTGLDDTTTNHYSTAHDIAIMSCEIMKHSKIKDYTKIWMDSLRNGKTQLVNTNKLVRFYEGITGLKTGTTSKAGHCVSATACRNNMNLVAVVMGCEDGKQRFKDAQKMLNWGFANFTLVTPKPDVSQITDVNVLYGVKNKITPIISNGGNILIKKGDEEKIKQRVDLCIDVEAPVEKGQVLGKIYFESDGKILSECSLISENLVERRNIFYAFKILWSSFAKK